MNAAKHVWKRMGDEERAAVGAFFATFVSSDGAVASAEYARLIDLAKELPFDLLQATERARGGADALLEDVIAIEGDDVRAAIWRVVCELASTEGPSKQAHDRLLDQLGEAWRMSGRARPTRATPEPSHTAGPLSRSLNDRQLQVIIGGLLGSVVPSEPRSNARQKEIWALLRQHIGFDLDTAARIARKTQLTLNELLDGAARIDDVAFRSDLYAWLTELAWTDGESLETNPTLSKLAQTWGPDKARTPAGASPLSGLRERLAHYRAEREAKERLQRIEQARGELRSIARQKVAEAEARERAEQAHRLALQNAILPGRYRVSYPQAQAHAAFRLVSGFDELELRRNGTFTWAQKFAVGSVIDSNALTTGTWAYDVDAYRLVLSGTSHASGSAFGIFRVPIPTSAFRASIRLARVADASWEGRSEETQGLVRLDRLGGELAPPVTTRTAPVAQDGPHTIVLLSAGPQKLEVMKAVRAATGLGWTDVKKLVESAPQPVLSGLTIEKAEELKRQLETAGARAEVR